jgi:hypothetical protein
MQANTRKSAEPSRLIGYARVSTEAQGTDPHVLQDHSPEALTIMRKQRTAVNAGPNSQASERALARTGPFFPFAVARLLRSRNGPAISLRG